MMLYGHGLGMGWILIVFAVGLPTLLIAAGLIVVQLHRTPATPTTANPARTAPIAADPTRTAPITADPTRTAPIAADPNPTAPIAANPARTAPIAANPNPTAPIAADPAPAAERTLADRLARGEIDTREYEHRLRTLRAARR